MRINAERERIKKYQEITKGSAFTYYNVLKKITEEYEKYKKDSQKTAPQPSSVVSGGSRESKATTPARKEPAGIGSASREASDPLSKIQ